MSLNSRVVRVTLFHIVAHHTDLLRIIFYILTPLWVLFLMCCLKLCILPANLFTQVNFVKPVRLHLYHSLYL